MNVARMNFSHNTHADHQTRIDIVKQLRQEMSLPIAILLDTAGSTNLLKVQFVGSRY